MGSHGMRDRVRRSRGLSDAVAAAGREYVARHGWDPFDDEPHLLGGLVETELRRRGLQVCDIPGHEIVDDPPPDPPQRCGVQEQATIVHPGYFGSTTTGRTVCQNLLPCPIHGARP